MRTVLNPERRVPADLSQLPDPFAVDDARGTAAQGDGCAPAALPDVRAVGASAVRLVILGQAYSKANSRKIVTFGERAASIKSPEARAFERDALRQIPPAARVRLEGPVRVTMRLFYATERPDLDESLVLDVLQDRYAKHGEQRHLVQAGVYRNDRQVREKHVYHAIDRVNPRAEILVEPIWAQQQDLL